MAEPVLRFDHVTKYFRPASSFFGALVGKAHEIVEAVSDVSFDLLPGEILGLIGQSGSGKTTTGRLAIKLLDPSSGKILLDGQDLTGLTGERLRKSRAHFQMVFQDPYQSLNPRMTVRRLLEEPLTIHAPGLPWSQRLDLIREGLRRIGLEPVDAFLGRYPHELSGGQRQRVAIGRAVILRPRVLVADEPVSMLDVSVRSGILRLLLDLRESLGMAQLFITHDLAVAKHVCDRIAVMQAGRIVEIGPSRTVLSKPSHPYTRLLMKAVPDIRLLTRDTSDQRATPASEARETSA